MNALRQRMIQDMKIRNYSPRTIDIYIRAVALFAAHFNESPERLGPDQIRTYQVFLVETRKVSWSVFNQVVCALRFLYNVTLGRKETVEHIPYARPERKLPDVLSVSEIARFFDSISNLKHRTVLMTMYGGGLRISEVLQLRIRDVDSERMVLRIRQGKGRKDRYAPLTPMLLCALRTYWKQSRSEEYLFPGRKDHPLSSCSIQKACKWGREVARISKTVTTHTMRHCFATHHLEAGTDLRTIQLALGHSSLNTTAVYLHVATGTGTRGSKAPVDLLGAAVSPQKTGDIRS